LRPIEFAKYSVTIVDNPLRFSGDPNSG